MVGRAKKRGVTVCLGQNRDILGHVHTAGNPGRGELDDAQEVHYPAVMRKLLALKYAGYVGQEFIPTRDPLEGLRQAVRACDVGRPRSPRRGPRPPHPALTAPP